MISFSLNENLELGVASSSTQIEGGDVASNWNDWFSKGKIKDGSDPSIANDHFNKFKEDLELMASLGIKYYRFGIEWARIEPSKGVFSKQALEHYRQEILYMKKLGITPLLTLHHFSNPMWFENLGGFENSNSVNYFLNFVENVISYLGDIVDEYITINEPNVYGTMSYYFGVWPPGKKSFKSVRIVYRNLCISHIKSYNFIHAKRIEMGFKNTKISFANHIRIFQAKSRLNPYHQLCARLMAYLFQNAITKAMSTGKRTLLIGKLQNIKISNYYDFIALNYYTRSTVSGFADGVKENVPTNDLGWEIFPKGIVLAAKMLHIKYPSPIYITENGTCDNEDKFRSKYIYEHLKEISSSNLPIQRYYHWSFTDNFEWIEGESARFGLVHVDYETQKRTVKMSGEFYKEIIKERKISDETYKKYVQQ